MLVGTSEQIERVGLTFEHSKFLCCTPYLVEQGQCNQTNVNHLVIPSDMNPLQPNNTFYYFPISFGMVTPTEAQGSFGPYRINITEQAIWYMLVVNCEDDKSLTAPTVRLTGVSEWVNPFGYLPGQLYGQMPVYWTLTILYFVFFISWCISCCCFRHSLHPVQYAMLAVLLFSFLENMIWGGAFVAYNQIGVNDNLWNGLGTFFLAIKLTISRIMMLLICMGYSITNSEIARPQQYAVLGLALTYFIIVAANHFVTVLQDHGEQISYASTMLLVFLDFIISGTLFVWMFAALYYTRLELMRLQHWVKLRMYTILAIVMGTAFGFACLVFILEVIIQMAAAEDKAWLGEFFFTLFWEFAFFFILVAVAIIWRPMGDNYRYAHLDEGQTNDQELESMGANPEQTPLEPPKL